MLRSKEYNMADVKRLNDEAGRFWFEPATMRFFSSKIESELYANNCFITSEQRIKEEPRLFTVRQFDPETAAIKTVGKFQQYGSVQEARDAIESIA